MAEDWFYRSRGSFTVVRVLRPHLVPSSGGCQAQLSPLFFISNGRVGSESSDWLGLSPSLPASAIRPPSSALATLYLPLPTLRSICLSLNVCRALARGPFRQGGFVSYGEKGKLSPKSIACIDSCPVWYLRQGGQRNSPLWDCGTGKTGSGSQPAIKKN